MILGTLLRALRGRRTEAEGSAAPLAFESGRATVPGAELAWDAIGRGAPLVLVMGLGVQRIHWPDGFCRRLAEEGFRVVRFDLRDSGESRLLGAARGPRPARALARLALRRDPKLLYDLDTLAADLPHLADALGLEGPLHLVGMSFGGAIAQRCAVRHPARVASLTSIASTTGALRASVAGPRGLATMLAPPPRSAAEAERQFLRALRLVGSPAHRMDDLEAGALAREAFAREADPSGRLRLLLAMLAAGDRTAELAAVRCPTLVLHGTADRLVPPAGGRATAAAIPGATLQLVPGMGHDLPEALWPTLVDAIAQNAHAARPATPKSATSKSAAPKKTRARKVEPASARAKSATSKKTRARKAEPESASAKAATSKKATSKKAPRSRRARRGRRS